MCVCVCTAATLGAAAAEVTHPPTGSVVDPRSSSVAAAVLAERSDSWSNTTDGSAGSLTDSQVLN